VLEIRADILALHAKVFSNLLHTSHTICSQVYLSPAIAPSKNLFYLGEISFGFRSKRKGIRLFDRIDLMLNLCQAVEDLLIPIKCLFSTLIHTTKPF